MEIEKIIREMKEDHPAIPSRKDFGATVDGTLYKVTAYKIRNQGLIRIDIRPLEKTEDE